MQIYVILIIFYQNKLCLKKLVRLTLLSMEYFMVDKIMAGWSVVHLT